MLTDLISRCLIIVLGTLYPAYRSYKALKNKNVHEHVKWMMYWIVFALFTTCEVFLDIFISWLPFYYEIKILFIIWILSPATRGSSLLYKKIVHPLLKAREKEIDEFIEKTKQHGYSTFIQLATSAFQYASSIFVSSALKSHSLIENHLRKSLSMGDVNNPKGTTEKQIYLRERRSDDNNEDDDDIIVEDQDEYRDVDDYDKNTRKQIKVKSSSSSSEISQNKAQRIKPINEQMDSDDSTQVVAKRSSKRSTSKTQEKLAYKTSEASHFGTITRSKKSTSTSKSTISSKSKTNQAPQLLNDDLTEDIE